MYVLALLVACGGGKETGGGRETAAETGGHETGGHETGGAGSTEELGKALFTDPRLSRNGDQACAACHAAEAGWTGGDQAINEAGAVYEGSVPGAFGDRKPTASAYATLSPIFSYDAADGFRGGNFWDGRATGWKLGTPAEDQAQGPFLNPVEQALPDAAAVVSIVCAGDYAALFRSVWGDGACDDPDAGFEDVARSIAAWEGSPEVSAFSSKYDAYVAGDTTLSADEEAGRALFEGKANCTACHAIDGDPVAFTDATYADIGVPRNPDNPTYVSTGGSFVDPGLGGFLSTLATTDDWRTQPSVDASVAALTAEDLTTLATQNLGRHRVPTLRNVDLRPSADFVKAYTHDGWFQDLPTLVHFYNTRDVLPRCGADSTEAEAVAAGCWPAPEVPDTVSTEVGNLGLTPDEEAQLVAFLGTLSDGWAP